jgi:hypothetical protein
LLQVLLLLVVIVGWSHETSLAHAMRRIPSSIPNLEKFKLPTTPLLLRLGPPSPLSLLQHQSSLSADDDVA